MKELRLHLLIPLLLSLSACQLGSTFSFVPSFESWNRADPADQPRRHPHLSAGRVKPPTISQVAMSQSEGMLTPPSENPLTELIERNPGQIASYYPLPKHDIFVSVFAGEHPQVDAFVDQYLTTYRIFLEELLDRREQYLPVMEPVFRKYELPPDLINVAMIESGFKEQARSNQGAVGMWQLIPTTARKYGLEVSRGKDERLDPARSTDAAARHLLELFDIFQSWELVIAAYNSGLGTVKHAIAEGGSRDFYDLAAQGYFHKETIDFVSRFLALTRICRNAAAFGFHSKYDLHNPVAEALVRE